MPNHRQPRFGCWLVRKKYSHALLTHIIVFSPPGDKSFEQSSFNLVMLLQLVLNVSRLVIVFMGWYGMVWLYRHHVIVWYVVDHFRISRS